MRVDLDVAQHQVTWDELARRVTYAEDTHFGGAWVFDHLTPLYGPRPGPCLEAWTLLAALAARTTRIRLGTLVTGMTYRHPSVLAAEVVTVDHVSGGRVELGLGAAWHEVEHRELGIPFPPVGTRMDLLEEGIEVIKALLTTDGATYEGRHYRLDGATYRPRSLQHPHPPVWIGGGGERRTLPLVARHADVWHHWGSPEAMARKSALVDRLAEEAGRDPASIVRATNLSLSEPWDEVRRQVDGYARAGFTILVASWPSEGRQRLEEFATSVLPEVLARP